MKKISKRRAGIKHEFFNLKRASLYYLNVYLSKQVSNDYTQKMRNIIIEAYQQDEPDYFNFNNQNLYNEKLNQY